MKLLLTSTLVTVATASQLTDMMADLMTANSKTSTIRTKRDLDLLAPGHNLFLFLTDLTSDYGCWCRMGTNSGYVGNGHGEAQDEFDAECKFLHDNYACLVLEESTCDPYNVEYERPMQAIPVPDGETDYYWLGQLQRSDLTASEIETECTDSNGGNSGPLCERSACIIESKFLHKFFQLFMAGKINTAVYASSSSFDQSICYNGNSVSGGARGDKQCCGSYSTYKQIYYDGTKGCCDNAHVFSTTAKICCSDGTVKEIAAGC